MKKNSGAKILIGILALYLGVCGACWIGNTPSQEEYYGGVARFFWNFRQCILSGPNWWSDAYMMGHSAATMLICSLPLLLGTLGVFFFGDPAGVKVVMLLVVAFGAWGIFLLVRRLTHHEGTACVAGILYATSSQVLTRIANFEHFMGSVSYAFIPMILWAFLLVRDEDSWRARAWLALGWSGMMLSYTKLAFLFLPIAFVYFLWLFQDQPNRRDVLLRGSAVAAVGVLLMAALLLLPLKREFPWVAAFSFDNFAAWQQSFSIKNFISVLDRGNLLLAGMRGDFLADRGQFYLGAVTVVAVGAVFWGCRRNPDWLATREGSLLRLFVGLALLALWLSQGPFSVFTGTREFLQGSAQAPDWLIALMWLMTLIPLVLIPMILPEGSHRRSWAALLILIYLFVPGFVLLEKLPIYRDIRAPWGFWEVGFFAAAVAGALALQKIWEGLGNRWYRYPLAALAGLALLVDSGVYLAKFFAPGLPAQTFADFDRSQEYLRASPIEGRVYPLSGRYFYLRTPMQSGRGLNSEAAWSHFQMKGVRALLDGANASLPTMQTYMRVAGISHVLLDKQDPFTPQEFQNAFAQMYPTGFDSEYIRVLENKDSLAPAFLAREYLAMDSGTERLASGFLDLAGKINVVPVELDPNERSYPFLAGMGSAKGEVQLTPDYAQAIGVPFQRVPYRESRNNPSKMVFDPAGAREGWLVVTEAWHPDWHAYASGVALPVRKAFGGLMAVNLTGTQGPVEFIFQAPRWYDLCVWISGVSWAGVVGLLILMPMPFIPRGWKDWWTGGSQPKGSGIKPKSSSIGKTVVVVPTYNERESISKVLDRVLGLARKVDVLVVDDGSPDGTAELVKSRPEFNKRVYLLEGEGKAGLGTAYRKGFQWALKHGYGAAVEMDADLSHDPDDIPKLLDALEQGAHLAVGSRYLGGVSVLNWPRRRILISTLGGWYVRFLTGLALTDPTSGFKAIRAEVLRDLDWGRVGAEGYAFQIELHHAAWKQGYVVREIPIVFTERREGESKMSVGISLEAAWRVLRLAIAG